MTRWSVTNSLDSEVNLNVLWRARQNRMTFVRCHTRRRLQIMKRHLRWSHLIKLILPSVSFQSNPSSIRRRAARGEVQDGDSDGCRPRRAARRGMAHLACSATEIGLLERAVSALTADRTLAL